MKIFSGLCTQELDISDPEKEIYEEEEEEEWGVRSRRKVIIELGLYKDGHRQWTPPPNK